jgi:hypothetical protein
MKKILIGLMLLSSFTSFAECWDSYGYSFKASGGSVDQLDNETRGEAVSDARNQCILEKGKQRGKVEYHSQSCRIAYPVWVCEREVSIKCCK